MSLGIDGKYLNGEEEIFVIGEVEDKDFLGVTMNNRQTTLIKTLRENIRDKKKKVKVVNMDMDGKIKGAVRTVFEDVPIVTDKFHVIKFTNRVIDLCRVQVEKSLREKLEIKRILLMKTEVFHKVKHKEKWKNKAKRFEAVLKEYSDIRLLWDLKNKIHGFYNCSNLQNAKKSWKALLQFLENNSSVHPEFKQLKRTLLNWEKEILNYFIFRTTNAYIEGINNRIETLKRKKWGFRNKENFIKCLCYMLFPITQFFDKLIFSHWF